MHVYVGIKPLYGQLHFRLYVYAIADYKTQH